MDIALYDLTGKYEDETLSTSDKQCEITEYNTADADPTSSQIETIAGKVLKFLYTYKGTDAFYPDYGGTAMFWKNISEQTFSQFKIELNDDITNCVDYIKTAENALDSSTERLQGIYIRSIDYPVGSDKTRLNIHLIILTTSGAYATLRMTTSGS